MATDMAQRLAEMPVTPGLMYLIVEHAGVKQLIEQKTYGNISNQRVVIDNLTQEAFDAFFQEHGKAPEPEEDIVLPKGTGFSFFPKGKN